MYTIHDREPIPFALVQPHQQVKPFGRPATARAARTEPLNLRVNDIAGTSTRQHCFATSPRLTNPVDPHYQWPRNQQPDAPALKFIRNTLDTSDIPGSQVRSIVEDHTSPQPQIRLPGLISTPHPCGFAHHQETAKAEQAEATAMFACRHVHNMRPGRISTVFSLTAQTLKALDLTGNQIGE